MKKALNSKKNKYRINVGMETPIRQQDWGSFLSFKGKLNSVAEKERHVFFPKKETRDIKRSTAGEKLALREREKRKVSHQLLHLEGFSSHFGRKSRHLDFAFPWHASMSSKFSGVRNKVPHVNSEQTLQSLVEAFYSIALVLRKGGKVLIVNKNGEFSPLFHTNNLNVKPSLYPQDGGLMQSMGTTWLHFANPRREDYAFTKSKRNPFLHSFVEPENFLRKCGEYRDQCRPATAPFKWVGGCLTNWKEISKSVATLLYFSNRFGRFIKQNNIHFPRFKKMRSSFQGFLNVEKEHLLLKAPPQLLFLFNAHESQEILHEAITLQIPVVALTDSSTDLSQITYPIPINSDSIRLVHMCLSQLIQITDRQGNFSK